jgi:hypothetical protein
VDSPVEKGVLSMQDRLFQGLLANVMPTARLCRVDVPNGATFVGSLIFSPKLIGIIKGFRGR